MKIEKQLFSFFKKPEFLTKNNMSLVLGMKGGAIRFTKFEELEYIYANEGRCMSIRSRGKLSSIVVRNKKYGSEQRVFLDNPRLVLFYPKYYKKKQ